jgi:hypothetical protein
LVANKAEVAKQLVIMSLAIGKPLFLVVTMPQEGLLAFGAYKVLEYKLMKLVTIFKSKFLLFLAYLNVPMLS